MSHVVYRLIGPCESLLYIGSTNYLAGRLRSHRARLGSELVRYEVEPHDDEASARQAEAEAIRREGPLTNIQHGLPRLRPTGVGRLVWDLMICHGLTPRDLAERSGIPLVRVCKHFENPDRMKVSELGRMAAVLGTTAGAIVTEFEAAA